MDYQKKATTVDAVQFDGTTERAKILGLKIVFFVVGDDPYLTERHIVKDDWIVTETSGLKSPVNPDAFDQEYEPVLVP